MRLIVDRPSRRSMLMNRRFLNGVEQLREAEIKMKAEKQRKEQR